jgi:hypothetical protein
MAIWPNAHSALSHGAQLPPGARSPPSWEPPRGLMSTRQGRIHRAQAPSGYDYRRRSAYVPADDRSQEPETQVRRRVGGGHEVAVDGITIELGSGAGPTVGATGCES